ncbi:hypothetical protein PBY51_005683 [Eleginops maclovinus]|uniref:Uncharacterized protein n=1 Tax=Eleginops maclovinus TaxID=56733 RepID=A0AAN7WPA4_ELEMC|nr:hypothetical protein PBY51_005683 [Eleginops maclovinus]
MTGMMAAPPHGSVSSPPLTGPMAQIVHHLPLLWPPPLQMFLPKLWTSHQLSLLPYHIHHLPAQVRLRHLMLKADLPHGLAESLGQCVV